MSDSWSLWPSPSGIHLHQHTWGVPSSQATWRDEVALRKEARGRTADGRGGAETLCFPAIFYHIASGRRMADQAWSEEGAFLAAMSQCVGKSKQRLSTSEVTLL